MFYCGNSNCNRNRICKNEDVKPGDIVLSTNTDTMETDCKKVLEKYVRKTRELVHIIVGGKEIVSTPDHHTMLKEEDLLMPVSFV